MKLALRIHRLFGSVFALLLAMWFVSGAVMTFASWPAYEEHERLASAPPLLDAIEPPRAPAKLIMLEGQPTWLANDAHGVRRAYRGSEPLPELDEGRARAEVETRTGERVIDVRVLAEPDPWTVSIARREGLLPLYLLSLEGGRQVYLSPKSAEIVQESTRAERMLNWIGSIPHWIYFTPLRPHQRLWEYTCLAFAALGLIVSLSGSIAGVRLWWLRRRKNITRAIPDARLRRHQQLGLLFGLFVTTWLFSGALSVHPFDWTGDKAPSARTLAVVHAAGTPASVAPALKRCQQDMQVRELELTHFAGRAYAVCYGETTTRIVDLVTLAVDEHLREDVLTALASALHASAQVHDAYDAYYFPRKRGAPTALPYWRLELHDDRDSILYIEPARAHIAQHLTRAARVERWLYHGLHNLDFPFLYAHRALWRTVVLVAMTAGTTLALLGFAMSWRRWKRG